MMCVWFGRIIFPALAVLDLYESYCAWKREDFWWCLASFVIANLMVIQSSFFWRRAK